MNWNEYQAWVVSKMRKDLGPMDLAKNMALGLAGEAGECADHIKKGAYHGKPIDRNKMTKELGDTLFYLAGLAAVNQIELADVVQGNVLKLEARYPNGFDPLRAHAPGEIPVEEIEAETIEITKAA